MSRPVDIDLVKEVLVSYGFASGQEVEPTIDPHSTELFRVIDKIPTYSVEPEKKWKKNKQPNNDRFLVFENGAVIDAKHIIAITPIESLCGEPFYDLILDTGNRFEIHDKELESYGIITKKMGLRWKDSEHSWEMTDVFEDNRKEQSELWK